MTESHDPSEGLSVSGNGIFRVLDAAANRASEGLRVVEDFARFVLDDQHLTRLVKELRHDLSEVCGALPTAERHAARETQRDVGTTISTPAEQQRTDTWDVCSAGCQRVKQSLRSLEEFSKAALPEISPRLESLRYRFYTIEKSLGITHDSAARLAEMRLCVLVDGRDSSEEFRQLVDSLVSAGVGMIQLRDKRLGDAELVERGRCLVERSRRACKANPSPSPSLQGRGTFVVIINDRADIAAAVDADGVHLGQDDLTVKDARAVLGPRKLIGVSTHSLEQARAAVLDGANYLGAGPTFASSTKSFDAFPGPEFLRQVAAEIRLPTFAIGGIGGENLAQVQETGIGRVAVGGAVLDASDPAAVVSAILSRLF
jgi:thiamine-phosphate pyrophosphorylase